MTILLFSFKVIYLKCAKAMRSNLYNHLIRDAAQYFAFPLNIFRSKNAGNHGDARYARARKVSLVMGFALRLVDEPNTAPLPK